MNKELLLQKEKTIASLVFYNRDLYFLNISGFCISNFLFLLSSKNSCSLSIPTNFLPCKLAAIPVVELPVKGSNIQALGWVEAKISLVSTDKGF